MKKLKNFIAFIMIFCSMMFIGCGMNDESKIAEKVELSTVEINNVKFKNSDGVKLEQDKNMVTISGNIDSMNDAQKEAFNKSGITHIIAVKFKFDTERTLSKFEMKGNETKVYSDNTGVANYAGSLTEFLDSKDGEDAYVYLVLSANTEEYKLTSTYTDGTVSVLELKITATLATASAE